MQCASGLLTRRAAPHLEECRIKGSHCSVRPGLSQDRAASCATYWMGDFLLPWGSALDLVACVQGRPWMSWLWVPGDRGIRPPVQTRPLPPLHRSQFSGVWGLFSRPSPPASAQQSYKSRDPFISSPATTLPAPLIVRQTRLWTQSKLSVSSGFHVSSTATSLQVWWVISTEEGALYTAIRAAITAVLIRTRAWRWQSTWAAANTGKMLSQAQKPSFILFIVTLPFLPLIPTVICVHCQSVQNPGRQK